MGKTSYDNKFNVHHTIPRFGSKPAQAQGQLQQHLSPSQLFRPHAALQLKRAAAVRAEHTECFFCCVHLRRAHCGHLPESEMPMAIDCLSHPHPTSEMVLAEHNNASRNES